MKKAIFSIHLVEDDEGLVTVHAEMAGLGDKCLDVGMEIMSTLREAERTSPEILNVTGVRACDYFQ